VCTRCRRLRQAVAQPSAPPLLVLALAPPPLLVLEPPPRLPSQSPLLPPPALLPALVSMTPRAGSQALPVCVLRTRCLRMPRTAAV
jgi:hypothetical protein